MGRYEKSGNVFSPYRKGILAALGVLAQVAATATLPEHLQVWVPVLIALATALGVYAVPNTKVHEVTDES